MLARCYDSDEQRSAARIKPMNEFVKYLSDVLGRAEAGSDVIFAHFAVCVELIGVQLLLKRPFHIMSF